MMTVLILRSGSDLTPAITLSGKLAEKFGNVSEIYTTRETRQGKVTSMVTVKLATDVGEVLAYIDSLVGVKAELRSSVNEIYILEAANKQS